MCGLTGEIRFSTEPASVATVARMAEALAPRGPDGDGLVSYGAAAFGHRRLKIIDLTDHARQPMVDSALGLTIAYNGAIYNYQDLRTDLEGAGYSFFSTGDTEVILKAYHAWGPECVERFNGMFAFAIHERDSGRTMLARDRLGIKPLYIQDIQGGIRFASTLPALMAAGDVPRDIDPVALNYYMTFHAVVPAPHTIYKAIRKLPPATVLTIDAEGRRQERRYWSPSFEAQPGDADRTEDEWRDMTLDALRRAVERRLVADVPVGVLLSGGLDSSLITGLLAESGQTGLNTFSIGFETVGDEEGDEFRYSDIVAERFGTEHHKLFVDSTKALPELPNCIAAMSEPMVSHDNIGFYLLSQEVAKHVRVVQSGQGADEVFGGYHWYPPMAGASDPVGTYAKAFFDRDYGEYGEAVEETWLTGDHAREFVAENFGAEGAPGPVDKALRLDTTVMLVDDPVKRVDNMTMAWGLEARVPFLDHELVELAARVPADLKIRAEGKYILKEAARAVIPAEVIDRPKGYFPVPALKYLRGPFLDMVRDALGSRAARDRGLFQQRYLDRLLQDPEAHITPLRGSKLWQVALLELWMQAQEEQRMESPASEITQPTAAAA